MPVVDDDAFLRSFEAATLPKSDWRHRAHVKIAYLYLLRDPYETALARLRSGIKTYNAAVGIFDNAKQGYHETITQGWLWLVHYILCEIGPEGTADAFFDRNPRLHDKTALFYFYSRDLLLSPKARLEFVAPDLQPLPVSQKAPSYARMPSPEA